MDNANEDDTPEDTPEDTVCCTGCRKSKPEDQFLSKRFPGKLTKTCKDCRCKPFNRENRLRYSKEYRKTHTNKKRGEGLEGKALEEFKEKRRVYNRKYRERLKEDPEKYIKFLEANRARQKQHRERMKQAKG